MDMQAMARELFELVESVSSVHELRAMMTRITAELGFQHFALSHHIDIRAANDLAIRVHDYPVAWEDYYDAQGFGVSDPVHRASHVTSIGFCWSRMPAMITLTSNDRRTLALGRAQGIGDGFTVPANVPGEMRGSCSFANDANHALPRAKLPMAQLAGGFAFEAARRLWRQHPQGSTTPPELTDRQRDCALWVARGKTDWEVGRILGVSEETVGRHVKQACARYEVSKRTLLAIRLLSDGTLTFNDIFKR